MTACPELTRIRADTSIITKELVTELRVSTYDRSPGTQVGVSCLFDLQLVGPSRITCGSDGKWSGAPYCTDPTSDVPSKSSDPDESTILLIVLAVVVVFVIVVIIVICIALYYGKRKRRRDKFKNSSTYYGDDSMPYSVSDRITSDPNNVAMYNIYNTPPSQHHENEAYRNSDTERPPYRSSDTDWPLYRKSNPGRGFDPVYRPQYNEHKEDRHYHDDRKHYRQYRSTDDVTDDRNFRFKNDHMEEPRENGLVRSRDDSTAYHYPDRIYERNRNVPRGSHDKQRRYKTKCSRCSHETEMKHARSADDILSEGDYHRDWFDRGGFRRDNHLWHSMNSISNWSIPRPYYDA